MKNRHWILCLAVSSCLARIVAAGPVLLSATGQNVVGGLDQNYQIVSDTTGLYTGTVPGDAVLVTSRPSAWATLSGSDWIGPAADEASIGSTNGGTTTYQTTFSVANPSTASLQFSLLVDNAVTIYLNGSQAYQDSTSGTYNGFSTPADVLISSGFISGTNTLRFVVLNGFGPTGLDVGFTPQGTVPEPSTMALAASALLGLLVAGFFRRRRLGTR